jgi:lambda family phage portal protein
MGRLAYKVGSALDGLLGVISPRLERERQHDRFLAASYRGYAAAKQDLQTGGFGFHDQNVNRLIGHDAPVMRARVRQLCRDFAYFSRAVEAGVNVSISTGYLFQFNFNDNDAINEAVEEAWAEYCDSFDFVETCRLARRQEIEVGESFCLTPLDPEDKIAPVKVQMYEPEWLGCHWATPQNPAQAEVINGLEVDTKSGRVLAYHLQDPENWGQAQRIEAAYAIHTFQKNRPGQLRGVSPLVSAVLAAHDIGEYVGAEVDGAKKAAHYLATAKSPDPARFAALHGGKKNQDGVRVRELSSGIIELMHSSEDFKLLDHNRPGSQFEPTVNFITRMIAVSANLPYELVSGDYRGLSWSNIKGIRADLLQQTRPGQRRFSRQFCQSLFTRWLDAKVMLGALRLPGYWAQRGRYLRAANWIPPGIKGVDLLREARAALDLMAAGLEAPQNFLAKFGLDPRKTLKAIAAFLKMSKKEGVDLQWGRQPLKTNPAALGATEEATNAQQ